MTGGKVSSNVVTLREDIFKIHVFSERTMRWIIEVILSTRRFFLFKSTHVYVLGKGTAIKQ